MNYQDWSIWADSDRYQGVFMRCAVFIGCMLFALTGWSQPKPGGSAPVNGVWSDWSGWSACNATCGMGMQARVRVCQAPQNGGLPCKGHAREERACQASVPCPVGGRPNAGR
jgi:hypothetical protein